MKNYYFTDISHWEGKVDHQVLANAGHRLIISKASDSYHMPDKDGKFDIPANRHYDAYWVDNFVGTRKVGLLGAGYHFVRFDVPMKQNIEDYMQAIYMLPDEYVDDVCVGIVDMEQPSSQLQAKGLGKQYVSDMAVAIVESFFSEFEKLIFYAGSWWTDQWLTATASKKIATLTTCWEPEYPRGALALDKQSISVFHQNYVPTVPIGFSSQSTTKADDMIGKLFSHQFSAGAIFPPMKAGFDINRMEMDKAELFKYFGQVGEVDPPNPEPEPPVEEYDCNCEAMEQQLEEVLAVVKDLEANLASHHLDVMAKLEEDVEEVPEEEYSYPRYRFIVGEKEWTHFFRGLPPNSKGKTKLDLVDGVAIKAGSIIKLMASPQRNDTGWWIFADGNQIEKDILLATNLEGGVAEVTHQNLMYIELEVDGEMVRGYTYHSSRNDWKNTETGDYFP